MTKWANMTKEECIRWKHTRIEAYRSNIEDATSELVGASKWMVLDTQMRIRSWEYLIALNEAELEKLTNG